MNTKKSLGVLQGLKIITMKYIRKLLVGFGLRKWMTSRATGSSQSETLYKEELIASYTYQSFPMFVTENTIRQVIYSYSWRETCNDQELRTKEYASTSSGTILDMVPYTDVQKN